jgi:hypothetical protein
MVFSWAGCHSDDFSRTYPLSLMCYRSDRHEALLQGGVHLVFDLAKSLYEIPYG